MLCAALLLACSMQGANLQYLPPVRLSRRGNTWVPILVKQLLQCSLPPLRTCLPYWEHHLLQHNWCASQTTYLVCVPSEAHSAEAALRTHCQVRRVRSRRTWLRWPPRADLPAHPQMRSPQLRRLLQSLKRMMPSSRPWLPPP